MDRLLLLLMSRFELEFGIAFSLANCAVVRGANNEGGAGDWRSLSCGVKLRFCSMGGYLEEWLGCSGVEGAAETERRAPELSCWYCWSLCC